MLKLNLSKNIKYIEDEAFYNDEHIPSLSEITMDGGYIEEVGKKAFFGNDIKFLDIAIKHFKEDSFANNKIEEADLTYAKSFEKTSFRGNDLKKVVLNINSSYEEDSFNEDTEIEEVKEDLGEDEEEEETVDYLKVREDRLKEEAEKRALEEEKALEEKVKLEEANNVEQKSIESKEIKEEKPQVKKEEIKKEDKKESKKEENAEKEIEKINSDLKLIEPKKLNNKEYKDLKDKNKVSKRLSFKDFFIKTAKAAEISEADGTKIESISSSWIGSSGNLLSLNWDDNEEKYVRFRTSYSLSGQHDYDPGMVQITIPKYIFKDRDGKVYGKMTLGVPELPGGDSEFAYYDNGNEYILINVKKIKAASQGFFEGTVKELTPSEIKDKSVSYKTDDYKAKITVTTLNDTLLSKTSNILNAEFNTREIITDAFKKSDRVYEVFPKAWDKSLKPKNPDDYIYVSWMISAKNKGNQSFKVDVEDIAENGETTKGAKVLGIRRNSDMKIFKGEKINKFYPEEKDFDYVSDNEQFRGMAYVAYPKSNFFNADKTPKADKFTLENKVKYTLTSEDDKEITSKTVSAKAISENDILDLSYQFYNIDFEDMIEDCCYFIWDYRKKLESLFKECSINFTKYSDSANAHDKSNIIYKFEVDSNNKTAILNEIELLRESLKADIQNIPAASYKFKGVKIFNIKIKYDSNIIFKIYAI